MKNIQTLASIPLEKQTEIRADIKKYLKGYLRMKDISAKHKVTTSITQKLLRLELCVLGFGLMINK